MKPVTARLWVLGAIAFFLGLTIPRLSDNVAQDETHYYFAANTLYREWFAHGEDLIVCSPHLYPHSIQLVYRLTTPNRVTARIPGVIAWLLAGFGGMVIARALTVGPEAEKQRRGVLAFVLCLTLPAAAQGAAIIDIDNTVLAPAILLLCWCAYCLNRQPCPKRCAWFVAALALALWCRVTTPIIVAPGLAFFALWADDRGRRSIWWLVLGYVGGILLFMATWGGYCVTTRVLFWGPFLYAARAFAFCTVGSRGLTVGQLAQNTVYTTLWAGAIWLLLAAALFLLRAYVFCRKRECSSTDLFLAVGMAIVLGYLLVGGTLFGFPKYHCPGLVLLAVGVALRVPLAEGERRMFAWLLGICIVAALLQWFLVGDVLYSLRLTLREAAAEGGGQGAVLKGVAWRLIAGITAFLGLVALVASKLGRSSAWAALLALAVVVNACAGAKQTTAGYHTGYNYGDRGWTAEVARHLSERVPEGAAMVVPGEIDILLKRPQSLHVLNSVWEDREELRRRLAEPQNRALVVGIITNTVSHVRLIREDVEIQRILMNQYESARFGPYFVWVRKTVGNDATGNS